MIEALVVSQVVLCLMLVALALVLLALARQIGVLHERIAPLGALMMDRGTQVGQPAPVIEGIDLQRRSTQIGGNSIDGKGILLLFISPACPACKKLIPILKSFARNERRRLKVLMVSDGNREENERFVHEERLQEFSLVLSPEIGMTYQIGKLPYVVLIDKKGIIRAKGLVNSREHLESLLEAEETGYASMQDYLTANVKKTSHVADPLRSTDHRNMDEFESVSRPVLPDHEISGVDNARRKYRKVT